MAVLDIKLDDDLVHAVADALIERGVPIVFVTGYHASAIPARFADVPRREKPVSVETVVETLAPIVVA